MSIEEQAAVRSLSGDVGTFPPTAQWKDVIVSLLEDFSQLTMTSRFRLLRACKIARDYNSAAEIIRKIDDLELYFTVDRDGPFGGMFGFNSSNFCKDRLFDSLQKSLMAALGGAQLVDLLFNDGVKRLVLSQIKSNGDLRRLNESVMCQIAIFLYNADVEIITYEKAVICRDIYNSDLQKIIKYCGANIHGRLKAIEPIVPDIISVELAKELEITDDDVPHMSITLQKIINTLKEKERNYLIWRYADPNYELADDDMLTEIFREQMFKLSISEDDAEICQLNVLSPTDIRILSVSDEGKWDRVLNQLIDLGILYDKQDEIGVARTACALLDRIAFWKISAEGSRKIASVPDVGLLIGTGAKLALVPWRPKSE